MVDAVSDIGVLLTPINSDNPSGDDLRFSPIFDQIRVARPQGDRDIFEPDGDASPSSDWSEVVDLATGSLATQSKDLRIAAWLVEGLVHQHGFAGLRDGLRVVNGLLENYWDSLHPRLDEQEPDLEVRLAPLLYLTSSDSGALLPNYLRDAPLTPPNAEGRGYSLAYYEARQMRGAPSPDESVNAERQAEATAKAEAFDGAVAAAPYQFFVDLQKTITEAHDELKRFDKLLDDRFGREAPSLSPFRQIFEQVSMLVGRFVRDKQPAAESNGEATDEHPGVPGVARSAGVGGPINSRDQALKQLTEVANYLRRAEPQSPIPYLLDRAVIWARKPLHLLLPELTQIFQILAQNEPETDSTTG